MYYYIQLFILFFVLFKIPYFRTSIKEKDKMSTKFTEYKGLDLPTVASEVLDFWKKENIFEQSVTTREGNPLRVFLKVRLRQMDYRNSPCNGTCHQRYFLQI
jgi:hypothetical protein